MREIRRMRTMKADEDEDDNLHVKGVANTIKSHQNDHISHVNCVWSNGRVE